MDVLKLVPPRKESRFDTLLVQAQREVCLLRVLPKRRSVLMRALYRAALMPLWNPTFLDDYTTTLFFWIYMPEEVIGTEEGYRVLRHELVHVRDAWRTGLLPFALSYLFLLPAGLTLRAFGELRAYTETMRVEFEETGTIADSTLEAIAEQFTGPAYLWMLPFPRWVRRMLKKRRAEIIGDGVSGNRR